MSVIVGEGAAFTVAVGRGLAMMRFTAPPFSVVRKAELPRLVVCRKTGVPGIPIFSGTENTGRENEIVKYIVDRRNTFLLDTSVAAQEGDVRHRHNDALRPRGCHCWDLVRQKYLWRLCSKSDWGP